MISCFVLDHLACCSGPLAVSIDCARCAENMNATGALYCGEAKECTIDPTNASFMGNYAEGNGGESVGRCATATTLCLDMG